MRTAYLLVSHGSSDPRHQNGLTRVANGVCQHLHRRARENYQAGGSAIAGATLPGALDPVSVNPAANVLRPLSVGLEPVTKPLVGTATLEAASVSLAEQIQQFARHALAQGIRQIVIVPLFLSAGVHVKEDLPREIANARAALPQRLRLITTPFLGGYDNFRHYVAQRLAKTDADQCLLLAHGSRRPSGNRPIRQLAIALNAEVAFWAVAPDLETQVAGLLQQGCQRIAIAPYFLFPGSLTDAIARRTEELAERLPKLSLRLLAPLGTSADLGQAVADLALSAPHAMAASHWQTSATTRMNNEITA